MNICPFCYKTILPFAIIEDLADVEICNKSDFCECPSFTVDDVVEEVFRIIGGDGDEGEYQLI